MKSARGFSTILLIVIGAIVLGVVGLNYASNNLRGKSFSFGYSAGSPAPKKLQEASPSPNDSIKQSDSQAKLDIKITDSYFPVTGTTILDLHNFLVNKGPDLETGHKGVANCRMGYEWTPHISSSQKSSQCRIDQVELLGKIECNYPKWDPPAGATQETKDKWGTYMKGVRMHEQGHIDIDKKSLNSMFEQLKAITTKPTCDEIRSEVVKIGNDIKEKTNKENLDYDLETQHGEKQGVYLIAAPQ